MVEPLRFVPAARDFVLHHDEGSPRDRSRDRERTEASRRMPQLGHTDALHRGLSQGQCKPNAFWLKQIYEGAGAASGTTFTTGAYSDR